MVEVRSLSHSYGQAPVLRDINFRVESGEVLAVMGSSGGGKTTLLRCISGLINATEGQILIGDINVREQPEEARKHMGMVFQSAALFDYMNVFDNVEFGILRTTKLKANERKARVMQALDRVGLAGSERKMPSELSGGMRKRVGIARAIALQPRLLLYDEPTTGLDPITTYTVDELILHLCRELEVTSIVVSHDVNSVFRTADRIAFLHRGELIFLGTPEEFARTEHEAIREMVTKARAESV